MMIQQQLSIKIVIVKIFTIFRSFESIFCPKSIEIYNLLWLFSVDYNVFLNWMIGWLYISRITDTDECV